MNWYYRTRQFWNTISRKPNHLQLETARENLSPALFKLFLMLHPGEQYHSFLVMDGVRQMGGHHPDLLTAALLHDIGKAYYRIHLWERVAIVLGREYFPDWVKRINEKNLDIKRTNWLIRPFIIANKHATWGAEILRQAGASEFTSWLVDHHHDELCLPQTQEEKMLYLLIQADKN